MQKINTLLNEAASKALKPHSSDSQTEAGQSETKRSSGVPDLIDAINQVFAEFELAYHNQYYKAYADQDRLVLAKKYWMECLKDFHPLQLVTAARRLVKTQEFLPTVSSVIRACEQGRELFGLPSDRDAYIEACRAPAPKSAYKWSHPAVYHAGKATDWYILATESEDKVFPLFAYNYRQLCDRVIRGEELEMPVVQALENNPSRPLSFEERQKRMEKLRTSLNV